MTAAWWTIVTTPAVTPRLAPSIPTPLVQQENAVTLQLAGSITSYFSKPNGTFCCPLFIKTASFQSDPNCQDPSADQLTMSVTCLNFAMGTQNFVPVIFIKWMVQPARLARHIAIKVPVGLTLIR